jgi:hypothetical protein
VDRPSFYVGDRNPGPVMNPCQSSEGAVVPEENRVRASFYGGTEFDDRRHIGGELFD